jgi:hypothetical protein
MRGPAGNPTAVGARITVELADGSTQTSEIYAGSGYYSQSTAGCFVGWLEGNPPRKAHIKWPSGIATDHAVPPQSTVLILSAPQS